MRMINDHILEQLSPLDVVNKCICMHYESVMLVPKSPLNLVALYIWQNEVDELGENDGNKNSNMKKAAKEHILQVVH